MLSMRRVKIVAPKSSRRGIVCYFMGETLLFDATKFTSTCLSSYFIRRYTTAAQAFSLAS